MFDVEGQCVCTEWHYKAKNAMWRLQFSQFVQQKMSEKVWRMDLLSLSKAKEKTNINHSSAHGPKAQSLGEWHKDS